MDSTFCQLPQCTGKADDGCKGDFGQGTARKRGLDDLLKEGLIQRFEYTHELAWKVMKDFAEYQGYTEIRGSRDAFRIALQMGLIEDSAWMDSIADRNLTSHNYDEDVAEEVYQSVVEKYHPLFLDFEKNMLSLL